MKTNRIVSIASAFAVGTVLLATALRAQPKDPLEDIIFGERNMGGPRLGVTYVYGSGKLSDILKRNNMGQTLSQFGWHFEYQVVPDGGGPSFVIQFVPLVAGVEYGTLVPSGTLAMGVRLPEGIEVGLGPNAMVVKDEFDRVSLKSALMMTVGYSFRYGGVNIPLNFVYTTNPEGNRFSLIFGYAIRKSSK